MWNILGSSLRSLFPELGSTQRNPLLSSLHPGSKQRGSVVCSLPGVMEWGRGHTTGTKKVRRWKTLWKQTTKKNPCSKAALCLTCAGLSFLRRQESSGLAFGGVVLESKKHIWGLVTPLGMQFPPLGTFRDFSPWHSGDALLQRRTSSYQEGFARWPGLTWDPKPSGFSTAIQT